MNYLGDFLADQAVNFLWSSNDGNGASITRATDGTISVYKDNSDGSSYDETQSTEGITNDEDFDSLVGIHECCITTTNAWYETGHDYSVVLSAATIDGQTVNAVLAEFSIENRFNQTVVPDAAGVAATQAEVATECETVTVTSMAADVMTASALNADAVTEIQSGLATPTNITAGTIATVTNQVTADVTAISGDATAADNLEATYDGTGYANDFAPATQASVGNIGSGAAGAVNFEAIEDNASGAIIDSVTKIGTPTGTFANTDAEDGSVLSIVDVGDDIDWVFGFNVGGSRQATEVAVVANLTGNQDDMMIQAYDIVANDSTWNTVGTLSGTGGDEYKSLNLALLSKHTGVGANLGEVYIRFVNDPAETPAILAIDKCLVAAVSTSLSVGYALGAIWVDSAGTAGTEVDINGTADNPCPWANALTLNDTLGLNRFHIANDNTITLGAAFADKTMFGEHYYLALGSQSVNDSHISGATVTGIGSAVNHTVWECCETGEATIPPSKMIKCGIGHESGKFTAASNGNYTFVQCYSLVPGSGSPEFDFDTNITGTTGINNRAWSGGANYSGVDANVTLSHEVFAGGGQTIVADAGGDIELRGCFRSATITVGGTDQTIQVVGTTGLVSLLGSATSGAVVNVYGVASAVTGTPANTTVNDYTINSTDQNAILADTNELQTSQGDWATATGFSTHSAADVVDNFETQSQADPTGFHVNVIEIGGTAQTANDNGADINAILVDTNSLNDTKIPDTISLAAINAEVDSALDTALPGTPTAGSINDYIKRVKFITCNKWTLNETTGASDIHDDSDVSFSNVAGAFASLAGVTTREKVI